MVKRGMFAAGLAALAVAGCSEAPRPAKPPSARQLGSTGQLLALTQCPLRISQARAWITRLPGQKHVQEDLHISASLLNNATAVILRSDASTADTLILEMRFAEESVTPGRIVYREPAPKPPYNRVIFRCHGGDVYVIRTIETAE
jgi:hypothetical protein